MAKDDELLSDDYYFDDVQEHRPRSYRLRQSSDIQQLVLPLLPMFN